MNTIETVRYEMLVRVRQFGEVHRDRFPKTTPGGEVFATVAAAVTELSGHAVSKLSTAREAKSGKAAAREALVSKLNEIAHAARVIAEETPGFDDAFRLPPKRQTDQRLLTTGRLFVRDAPAGKARFVALGIPKTFLADLTEVVDEFAQALLDLETARDGQAAARAGITTALESGLAAVRKLDVISPFSSPTIRRRWRCGHGIGGWRNR